MVDVRLPSFRNASVTLPDDFWTFEGVEERMVEAIQFLDRVSGGRGSAYAGDGPWGQIMKDRSVDYVDVDALRERGAKPRGGLTSDEVDRMNETLDWSRFVPERGEHRKIVGVVLQQLANGGSQVRWADVKQRLRSRQSTEVLRKGYSRSITRIASRLNCK